MNIPWSLVRLPPFPPVAMRVLQLVCREPSSLAQLSALIAADPAFSCEVLTIVNSPLYALRTPVTSVLQGIATLGLDRLRGLAVTVGVRAYLGDSAAVPMLRRIWRHCLACALIAEEYAMPGVDSGTAYTAGIMHDIGRVALARIHPEEYEEFLQSGPGDLSETLNRERELFTLDHCELGKRLVVSWNLPSHFIDITSRHHAQREGVGKPDLFGLIRSSCRMADAIGFSAAFPVENCYEELRREFARWGCGLFPAAPEDLFVRIATKINSIEGAC